MRITLDIDEKLMAEVMRFTGEKTKGKAVNEALAEVLSNPRSRKFLKAPDRIMPKNERRSKDHIEHSD